MNYQQHQWLGDNFDPELANIIFSRTINGRLQPISFGEVNAIAGDHIDVIRNFSSIDTVIRRMYIEVALPKRKNEGFWHGDYVPAARRNWHHFLPLCQWVWVKFHITALSMASKIPKDERQSWMPNGSNFIYPLNPSNSDMYKFAQALFLEGCGCHYLEDCFGAGHVRTSRIFYGSLYDALVHAKRAHDIDNVNEINVGSRVYLPWSLTGEQNGDFFNTGKRIKPLSRLKPPMIAVTTSVQSLFDIEYNASFKTIKKLIWQVMKYIPKQSIYWIPAGHPEAEKKGYVFDDRDDINRKSCIMHIEVLHYRDPDLSNSHEFSLPYVIVADLTISSSGAPHLDNFYFFERLRNGRYEQQQMFPSIHNHISQGDPIVLQQTYFPMHGYDILKKFNNYWPFKEKNDLFEGNFAPGSDRWK